MTIANAQTVHVVDEAEDSDDVLRSSRRIDATSYNRSLTPEHPDWAVRVAEVKSLVKQANDASRAVRDRMASYMPPGWAAGRAILRAKEGQLKHGQYGPFLDALGISDTTADRYIKLARDYPTQEALDERVAEIKKQGVDPSITKLLGEKRTPRLPARTDDHGQASDYESPRARGNVEPAQQPSATMQMLNTARQEELREHHDETERLREELERERQARQRAAEEVEQLRRLAAGPVSPVLKSEDQPVAPVVGDMGSLFEAIAMLGRSRPGLWESAVYPLMIADPTYTEWAERHFMTGLAAVDIDWADEQVMRRAERTRSAGRVASGGDGGLDDALSRELVSRGIDYADKRGKEGGSLRIHGDADDTELQDLIVALSVFGPWQYARPKGRRPGGYWTAWRDQSSQPAQLHIDMGDKS
jgi:hypothetical protein